MGVQDLQTFLDSNCIQGGVITVDLLKTARNVLQRHRNRAHKNPAQPLVRLKLVFDAECCLDRFYGGYFSDWACGGQWNRMVEFLASFIQNFDISGGEVIVFFNGCNEPSRRDEWIQNQLKMRMKVNSVIKHITTKGTPPPKIWWTPPACLRTALRLALRHLKMTVMCSMDDHHQEVIAYIRENSCHGLVADDAEYAVFDPPRYFSSEQMKLTYKGSLDTKEYLMSQITRSLGITLDRLCILGALLGNYILTEHELIDFYEKLGITATGPNKTNIDVSIKTIATFVKQLPSTAIDTVAEKVFGSTSDPRYSKLRQSVQYYINGTRQGFLHYKTAKSGGKSSKDESKQTNSLPKNAKNSTAASEENCKNLEASKFASETVESERESLNAYNEATGLVKPAPHIVIEAPPKTETNGDQENNKPEEEQTNDNGVNGAHNNLILSPSSSSNSSSATSPSHATTDSNKSTEKTTSIPSTVPEVMRTASERHQKGLMSPYIYQILVNGEIKLPVLLEDENQRETPSIHFVYRPVRQMVYAILFNLHHRNYLATKAKENNDDEKIEVPDVIIKEWVWSKANPYQNPEYVKAEPLGWGVPTIQRLWFGTGIDDKRRRLRAYLTCMRSDTPLMLNTSYVPQHLLVMASVIRYIMTNKVKILRRNELDAFCALAFSPELMESEQIQDLHLPLVSFRGVQLATLFMAGVETALLANDACGAPIPWLMCCPWLFFDGKLFHHTLARTTIAKNLFDLCDGQFDRFSKAGRMKEAILEGIRVKFARVPNNPKGYRVPQPGIPGCVLAGGLPPICSVARGRISLRNNLPMREIIPRPVPQRGGHLEVAGVIVGQWGANYGQPGRMPHQIGPAPLRTRGLTTQAPFPRVNPRMFQPRGTPHNPIAAKGKKTQMKATNKKKGAKKNQENCNKNDTTPCDNSEIPNADGFSKLLKKDAKEIIPSIGTESDDKNTVADKKDVEKGQDVTPQAASQTQ